jgi:endonuclease YncB( thermonuclease family)
MICMRVIAIASMIVASTVSGLPAAKAVEIVAAGKSFKCTPVAVWDGDGPIWCAEGPRIRISGVAAREMDGTCRANQPCPAVGALEARDRLVKLFGGATGKLKTGHITVKGPTMTCISEGGVTGPH